VIDTCRFLKKEEMNAKLLGFKGMVKGAKVLRSSRIRENKSWRFFRAELRTKNNFTGKCVTFFAPRAGEKIVDAPTKSHFEKLQKDR